MGFEYCMLSLDSKYVYYVYIVFLVEFGLRVYHVGFIGRARGVIVV